MNTITHISRICNIFFTIPQSFPQPVRCAYFFVLQTRKLRFTFPQQSHGEKVTTGVKKNPQTPLRVPAAEPESLRPFSHSRFIQAFLPPAICKIFSKSLPAVLKYKSFLTAARNLRKILQIPAAIPSFFSTEAHGRSMDPERILSFVIRKYEFLRLYNRAFPKTIQGKTRGRTIFF